MGCMVKTIRVDDEIHRDLKTESSRQGIELEELTKQVLSEYINGLSEGVRT